MFTGIVSAVGEIKSVRPLGSAASAGVALDIDAAALDLTDVAVGDSIAIQGACMTVTGFTENRFQVDVSKESLDRTTGLDRPGPVNLEKALAFGDRLGGHLVSGHVDGLAKVLAFEPVGESWRLTCTVDRALGRFLAYKGSVALNGVSLTVNDVVDDASATQFTINLIPHTLSATTLSGLKPGDPMNYEVDLIARYCERMLNRPDAA